MLCPVHKKSSKLALLNEEGTGTLCWLCEANRENDLLRTALERILVEIDNSPLTDTERAIMEIVQEALKERKTKPHVWIVWRQATERDRWIPIDVAETKILAEELANMARANFAQYKFRVLKYEEAACD